jgi:hypothetical protein
MSSVKLLSSFLRNWRISLVILIVSSATASPSLAQSVAGTLSSVHTVDEGTIDGCPNVIENIWTWTFTDPSGGTHPFPVSTQTFQQRGAKGTPCQPTITTAWEGWSTDNLYYLEATGGSGEVSQAAAFVSPAYQVVSILYAAPGNKSSAGFTNSTSDGATTTVGSSFTQGQSITFTYGFSPIASGSLSFGTSSTSSNSDAFTETFSDASGVSLSNSSTSNAINHSYDTFLIWLNPEVTVVTNGVAPVSYSVGVQPLANGTTPNPDIVDITANVMQPNASGVTTVPATWLNHQINPATGAQTPGLAGICKGVIAAEYAANTCTLADQCGCKPSDFAPILALDPLLSLPGTTSPLSVDTSGASACDDPNGSDKCRYAPVTVAPGNLNQVVVTLSGPDAQGDPTTCNNFTQGSSTTTSQTLGESTTESVSTSFKSGPGIGFSLTTTNTLSWMQSESTGTAAGTGYSEAVNLCSNTVGCGQDIPVYQDTVFHTFVFQQPSNNNSCP